MKSWNPTFRKAKRGAQLSVGPATVKNQLPGFSYDAAGNMTQNGGATYVYDAENRLKSAGGVTYTYDGDGNRVMKSSGTIYWGGGEGGALAETGLSGNIVNEYIFFDGKRIARVDDPGIHYYFSNHLNSTSVITDDQGNIQSESDYEPYGAEIPVVSGDPNHYKFTGKERDSESGLDYFIARHYASSLGRFISVDPVIITPNRIIDPQQLNRYAYVRNNPVVLTDPTGEDVTCPLLSCTQSYDSLCLRVCG